MRVSHVITRLIVGGAQENTIASVLGLRLKPNLEVSLLSGPTRGSEGSLEPVFNDYPGVLQIVPQLVRQPHPSNDWSALRTLSRIFAAQRPDIVHTHSGKAGVVGRLAAARAGVPLIIHTVHGPSFGPFQGWLPNFLFLRAERHAAHVTHHFVVVANAMKTQYLRAGIGRPDQFTRILSGFALEPFLAATQDPALRAQFGLETSDIVVGKIARLFKLKGHDDLLSVAPALVRVCPQLKFLLVGDGPWRDRFESKVRARGLEKHFAFAGLVSPTMVARLVGIMDLIVHLSSREGLPRALAQALAAARPVVAYDSDGASEVCFENQTGFLVPVGDRARLSERVLLLARDASLRERLGRTGREFVRQHFGLQQMIDAIHQLYLRLAQDHHR
jgi:glycosyltransferase involved in cell wall biosynthesis